MIFQVFDARGRQFLNVLDDNIHPIEPLYTKRGSWIKYFRHSNLLCARATRAIVNHASIGEYCLCFFPNENFSYPCKDCPIESRYHIFYNCRRFNNYWNLRQDTIGHFVSFPKFSMNVFFLENILHSRATFACAIATTFIFLLHVVCSYVM